MIKVTIFDRYIFKELLSIFTISLLGLTGVLLLEKIHFLSDLIFNKGVSINETLLLLFYISPTFLSITLPLSVLLASIMAFSRLSSESELVAMKACGVSLYRLITPVFVLAFIAYLATTLITVELQHRGNLRLKSMIFNILKSKADIQFKERVFNNTLDNMTIYVNKKSDNSPIMRGVFIHTETPQKRDRIIYAAKGQVFPLNDSVVLHLLNGTIHEAGQERDSYNLLTFREYDLKISFDSEGEKGGSSSKGRHEMSVAELKKEVEALKKRDEDPNPLRVEIHTKFAMPFACIAFGILGAPLGIRLNRSGKGASLGVGVVIMVLNYVLFMGGRSVGENGVLPPVVSMWLPNIIILGIALFILRRSAREETPFDFRAELSRAAIFFRKKQKNS